MYRNNIETRNYNVTVGFSKEAYNVTNHMVDKGIIDKEVLMHLIDKLAEATENLKKAAEAGLASTIECNKIAGEAQQREDIKKAYKKIKKTMTE